MPNVKNVTISNATLGSIPAVMAEPDFSNAGVAQPAVLVLHEIFGLNDDMRRIAERIAEAGYIALVPDFFGDAPRAFCILRAVTAMKRGRGHTFERLRGAHDWLAAQTNVDQARIGVVGFCMGGGFAVLYAAEAPVEVVGAFYGDVPKSAHKLQGIPPVIAGFGGRDRIFSRGANRLRRHLNELGVTNDVKTYPDAGHSYMSDHTGIAAKLGGIGPMRVAYNEAASEDSWARMLGFFARHLEPVICDDQKTPNS